MAAVSSRQPIVPSVPSQKGVPVVQSAPEHAEREALQFGAPSVARMMTPGPGSLTASSAPAAAASPPSAGVNPPLHTGLFAGSSSTAWIAGAVSSAGAVMTLGSATGPVQKSSGVIAPSSAPGPGNRTRPKLTSSSYSSATVPTAPPTSSHLVSYVIPEAGSALVSAQEPSSSSVGSWPSDGSSMDEDLSTTSMMVVGSRVSSIHMPPQ